MKPRPVQQHVRAATVAARMLSPGPKQRESESPQSKHDYVSEVRELDEWGMQKKPDEATAMMRCNCCTTGTCPGAVLPAVQQRRISHGRGTEGAGHRCGGRRGSTIALSTME